MKSTSWRNLVLVAAGVTLTLFPATQSMAGLIEGYEPPINQEEAFQRQTYRGGLRGCKSNLEAGSIALIVPDEQVIHQTQSARPEFFVYVNNLPPSPLKFTLVEPGVAEPLVEQELAINTSGIWQIALPPEIELQENKSYVWNLMASCGGSATTQALKAAVKRVPASRELLESLQQASSSGDKARLYAGSGNWYDTLMAAAESQSTYWSQLLSDLGMGEAGSQPVQKIELGP